jgi:exosome complex RNA-binding protein Rrp42 (RNase PH superfamily)
LLKVEAVVVVAQPEILQVVKAAVMAVLAEVRVPAIQAGAGEPVLEATLVRAVTAR